MWFTPENLDNAPAFFRNGFAATAHMRTNPPLSLEGATFSGPVITQEMVPAVGEDIMTPHGEANVTAVEAGRVRVRIKSNERRDEDEAHYDYHWVALADVNRIPLSIRCAARVTSLLYLTGACRSSSRRAGLRGWTPWRARRAAAATTTLLIDRANFGESVS